MTNITAAEQFAGSREGFIGHTSNGTVVYVTIELSIERDRPQQTVTHETVSWQTRVSVSGHWFAKGSRRRDWDGGGQCIDALRSVTRPAPGLVLDNVTRLAHLWDRWHLNDMRAACAHQVVPDVPEDVSPLDRTGWLLDNVPPCPETGYRYGSAWLYQPVPVDVLAELAGLASKLDGTNGLRR